MGENEKQVEVFDLQAIHRILLRAFGPTNIHLTRSVTILGSIVNAERWAPRPWERQTKQKSRVTLPGFFQQKRIEMQANAQGSGLEHLPSIP